MNKRLIEAVIAAIVCGLSLWLAVGVGIYRGNHPDLTETELLIHVWDAITFRS